MSVFIGIRASVFIGIRAGSEPLDQLGESESLRYDSPKWADSGSITGVGLMTRYRTKIYFAKKLSFLKK